MQIYLNLCFRNFLHGRIAANSLLGSLELERVLPQREVRIYIGTWNMNGQVNILIMISSCIFIITAVNNYRPIV